MKRTSLGLLFVLLCSAAVHADDSDAVKNCIAQWATACAKECGTAKCVANCTTQAHDVCTKNIASPQIVFSGPVTATLQNECAPQDGVPACSAALPGEASSCSLVSGTVANRDFWGGNVTIYVICPPGSPAGRENEAPTVTVIGRATSSRSNGAFSITVTNACSGQTGCYGLIAVTPPASCETCKPGDPNWGTCTGEVCPTQ